MLNSTGRVNGDLITEGEQASEPVSPPPPMPPGYSRDRLPVHGHDHKGGQEDGADGNGH